MSKIDELTREELVNLTPEARANIVDYECAVAGIKLLPEEPQMPEKQIPQKDLKLFEIEGDLIFKNVEDAQKVLDLITSLPLIKLKSKDYENYYGDTMTDDDYNYPNIKNRMVFTKDTHDKNIESIRNYKNAKKEYDEQKSIYNKIYKERLEIETKLQDAIDGAIKHHNDIDKYTQIFERYLKLADGNVSIAENFLEANYPEALDYDEITELIVKEDRTNGKG